MAFLAMLPAGAHAEAGALLTGPALERRLAEPVGVQWSGNPLGEAVRSLGRNRRVAVLLDRRVDPSRPMELTLADVPLRQAFEDVARGQDLGLTWFGPVAYWGPPAVTARLRTVGQLRRDEAERLPAERAKAFARQARMVWPDFATPRELLAGLSAEAGVAVAGESLVPHDLWAGADLPPLPLTDRLTLVLAQFDLTFQPAADGRTLAIVPLPAEAALVRSYAGGARPEQLAERWKTLCPAVEIKIVGDRVWVRGLLEDHERITGVGKPDAPRPDSSSPKPGEKRYTVREARGPLGKIIEQLAARLQLQVEYDLEGLNRAGVSLDQQVAFSAREATLEELLTAALKPAGCTFRRRGEVIEITASPK